MRVASLRRSRAAGITALGIGLCLLVAALPARGQGSDSFYGSLHPGDLVLARAVLQDTLETHRRQQAAPWRNDATGNSGLFTPLRTFRITSGFFCREFREELRSSAAVAQRTGTACRREDGVWIRVER